jgi:hypothetical protein
LPVLTLARRAYAATWRSLPALARFAAMPLVLLVILEGGFRHAANVAETWLDVTILDSLMSVLQAAILTPVVVAAYRLFLLGRETVRRDAVDDFPPGTVEVLALSVVFAVALLPFGDLLTLMDYETALMPSVALAYHAFVVFGMLLSVLLVVRTGFLFNAAVLGRDLNISLAWRQTRGNGWRLLGLILFCQAPVAALTGWVERRALSPLGGQIDFGVWGVWSGLLVQAGGLVLLAVLLAAAFSLAYGQLAGFPLPPWHGVRPVQPSLPFDEPPGSSGASAGSA